MVSFLWVRRPKAFPDFLFGVADEYKWIRGDAAAFIRHDSRVRSTCWREGFVTWLCNG
jgi:hypothetical protein